MLRLFKIGILLLTWLNLSICHAQTPNEQINILSDDFDKSPPFYHKIPERLLSTDTSPAFDEKGQKILLTGTVYKTDGKTPASNIVLYYYQTDPSGVYAIKEDEERNMPKNKLGQTHGYIRGWLRTDELGSYSIYTIKPGSYPSRDEPAHIHVTIKEEKIPEPYYIDDFVFDNDPLLTSEKRKRLKNRGGSGIIQFIRKDSIWVGTRDIILGLNIPKYE
ncbi:intradiol ring-cleavage dioxygenase [Maribacter aestuarii]|uniref:dioxygenase family protein n=1 Tax=Maribacter aestuarii TaxID=1130723 RepID=UPI00248BFB8C|nr:intradiol ring-cleavage dioxygenase [Maribacter aestuarii]